MEYSRTLVKKPSKPLLLKDYLLDDLNSCSSSGFRSYPRRQCCSTVRFLLEVDMKKKQTIHKKKPPKIIKNVAKPPLSTFQKVVKYFTAVKSTSSSKPESKIFAILPRSLSRKLLKKSFWKKNDFKEIKQWKPLVEEKSEPFMMKKDTTIVDLASSSNEKSDSWSDSDFTITTSEDSDVIIHKENLVNDERVKVTVGDYCDSMDTTTSPSSTNSKKEWTNEEEKEQFSPVSILDCPFDNEEDEVSSPFRHRLTHVEGTAKKLMKKLQKFERLAHLEPLNLEKKYLSTNEYPKQNASEYNDEEEKPLKLLELIKETMPSYSVTLEADNLLLDFFTDSLSDDELLSVAKKWIDGGNCDSSMEWDLKKNREAYVVDMESNGEWKNFDQELKEVVLEFEVDIFEDLVNEIMDDLFVLWKTT